MEINDEKIAILGIKNNAQLDAEDAAKKAAEAPEDKSEAQSEPIMAIASYIEKCWQDAKMNKNTIETRLLDCQRRRKGTYDSEKLEQIKKNSGSDIYMRLTSTKCAAGEAWIRDVLAPADGEIFVIEPTPKPDISPENMQAIIQAATQHAFEMAQMNGGVVNPQDAYDFAMEMRKEVEDMEYEKAKECAEKMTQVIKDQLTEGGFWKAFLEFLADVVTYPAGIIKGPVLRKKKCLKWVTDESTGESKPQVTEENVKVFERVSPYDIYPSSDCTNCQNGYIIERQRLRRSDIVKLRGVPGYNNEMINKVLDKYGQTGTSEVVPTDSERDTLNDKENLQSSQHLIEVLEFWGSVQGKMLIEWGYNAQELDPVGEYEIWAIKIGNYVIKAELNPSELGIRPYYATSFEKEQGSFWGYGVPEKMADMQDICNATIRAMVNNLAISSGPQAAINLSALASGEKVTDIYPRKIWQYNDPQGVLKDPIKFFNPQSNSAELLNIYNRMKEEADDNTGIPRYQYGNENMTGAGRTARGLAMLMTASAKSIKQVISNIDEDVIAPLINYLYYWNMVYNEDQSIKGDLKVKASGALSLIVKEQAQAAREEFLAISTQNPVILDIIGKQGVANILRENVKALDMNHKKLVPSEGEIRRQEEQQKMMMAMQQQQQQMMM